MEADCCFLRMGIASITVGNNPNPNLNSVCKANIDRDGIFACTTPISGLYIGLTRTSIGLSNGNWWHFAEIRAYSWVHFDETNSTLSADFLSNTSLLNSVHINELLHSNSVGGIGTDTLFSTGPAVNCWWMMNLGSSMHVKVVLIIGDYKTKVNT
jgi:hypothetical protein